MKKENNTLFINLDILAGILVIGNLLEWPIPLAGENRTALLTLGFLVMALCSQGIGWMKTRFEFFRGRLLIL